MVDLKLKESIRIIYDMELNNYIMNRAIDRLNHNIQKLGNKKKISLRNIDKKDLVYDKYVLSSLYKPEYESSLIIIPALLCGVIAAGIGAATGFNSENDLISGAYSGFIDLVIFGILGIIIGIVIGKVITYAIDTSYDKEQKSLSEAISKKQNELYLIDIAEDEKRVARELKEKELIVQQRDTLIKKKKESTEKLKKYYDLVEIDEKYRNIIPMGYMNEFVRLGIATKLEGVDGLYYLIRKELKNDQFQYSLNEISNKLDTLIDNTKEIYADLIQMNSKCDKLIKSVENSAKLYADGNVKLNEIAENTSITAYTVQRINEESQFAEYMIK